jgi:ABC-type polysaccharide/polyol phosphate export permease
MWPSVRAFVRRDFQLERSYRLAFVSEIATVLFSIITFSLVARLVNPGQVPGGYFTFATVGLALATFLQVGVVTVASNLRQDQVMGTLEALMASGTGVRPLAAGIVSYPFLTAAIRGVAFGAIAFAFGARTVDANWSLAVTAMVLGAISFAGIALAGAALILIFRQAVAATGWLLSIMTLAAGVLFPLHFFPGWAVWIADISPFTHTLRVARDALLEGRSWASGLGEVGLLVGMAVVFAALGIGFIAGGLAWARRSGTLAQY